ncbi:hypothetical protein C1S82_02850 [Mycolicibacterium cosmeticum]|uniref:Lipoprotein n=1 Tax=Mycolicibacterium cosmeticum TaxID=258533 RepID=W9B651_MYCCO|nr:hypothetical protein [Mycolicibacterium cosmeticum]TLH81644.1 hypothetical protein C1S82_02850 [Mycolicibacterium cosmeticum]CDO10201.1 lipoprotein [Mycolicibacterium cosmeticum]
MAAVAGVSVVLVVSMAAVAWAPPAFAEPLDPIPGNGVFRVGTDIAPGLYHTDGSGSVWGVWINDVPTQDSMCAWFTYSTPDAAKDHVVQTNTSIGPMFANIPVGVKAFESQNCQPWTRVP